MSKEQLLQKFAEAYEQLIETASLAAQRGVTQRRDKWGPREIVAHLAGWEVMASVRIPRIVASHFGLFIEAVAARRLSLFLSL